MWRQGPGLNGMTLLGRVVAQPSARRELLQALLGWAATARREVGAVVANVAEDVETPAVIYLMGEWDNPTAFEAHIRSDAFGILLGALGLLGESVGLTVSGSADEYGTDALPAIRRLRERGQAAVASGLGRD